MDVFSALADPVRRDLLGLLRQSATSAGDLAAHFDITRPAVSRHLRVLREAGLVSAEEAGRQRVYRLEASPLEQVDAWLEEFRDRWTPRLDALATEVHRTRRERRAATDSGTHEERTA